MTYRTTERMQKQKQQKRQSIIDAAIDSFAEKGYEGANIKDIVEVAGISVGSFYFYFSSKEQLLESILDEMSETHVASLEYAIETYDGNVIHLFVKAVASSVYFFANSPKMGRIMTMDTTSLGANFEHKRQETLSRFLSILKYAIEKMQQRHALQVYEIDIIAPSIMGAMYTVIEEWITGKIEMPVEKMCVQIIQYHLNALGVEVSPDTILEVMKHTMQEE